MEKHSKFYYGWVVCFCGFLAIFLGQMFYTNSMGLYTKAITELFGWSRGQFTIWTSISAAVMMACSPVIGRLYEKFEPRKVVCGVIVLQTIGYLGFSFSTQLWMFYLFAIFLGIGFGGFIRLLPSIAVNMWFGPALKGRAMAFATMGTALGPVAIVPLMQKIIASFGYQWGYWFTCLVNLFVLIPLFWFLIKTPEQKGVQRLGSIDGGQNLHVEQDGRDKSLKEILRTPEFYMFGAAQIIIGVLATGLMTNVTLYFNDIGMNMSAAAWVSSLSWATAIIGRLVLSYLSRKVGIKFTAGFAAVTYALAMIGLYFAQFNWLFIILYAAGYAIGSAITVMIPPIMTTTMWGSKYNGQNFGAINFCSGIGSVFGATLVAYVYTLTGTYANAWLTFFFAFLVCAFLLVGAMMLAEKRK